MMLSSVNQLTVAESPYSPRSPSRRSRDLNRFKTDLLSTNQKIYLNIAGHRYETFEKTLQRFPQTLLGNPERRKKYCDQTTNVYKFHQVSTESFDAILFYYQSNGCLSRPPWISMELFEYECTFFELDFNVIKEMKEREGFESQKRMTINPSKMSFLQKLWLFFEYPESSKLASIFMSFTILLITSAVLLDCFETLPFLSMYQSKRCIFDNWHNVKLTLNIYFALEFIARFIASPQKLKFFTERSNIIDMFSIFPSFLCYSIEYQHVEAVVLFRTLRTLRILRLLRLSKSNQTLAVVLHILGRSFPDLLMLIFCMFISCTLFGSMIFYVEIGTPDTTVTSIPEAMWLAMQTVVSIGYGDNVPKSVWGKIVTAITAVIGALTMTVPLLSLGGKYFSTYTKTYNRLITKKHVTMTSATFLANDA